MSYEISIKEQKCINCERCIAVCPSEIFLKTDNKIPEVKTDISSCIVCGHCVAICPVDAICHTEFPEEKVHKINTSELPSSDQLMELMRARRSNRVFTDSPISKEVLQKIIEAAHRAPTATNRQAMQFTVVTSPEKLREIGLFTVGTFGSIAKLLDNPLLKPILKRVMKGVYRYVPIFKRMESEFVKGNDYILRGATAAIFFHTPSDVMFGKEDSNLAYQNASLMAESLGVAQFYTGFICSASAKTKHKKLAKILGVEGNIVHAGIALGVPKYKFSKYIDRKDTVVTYI